MDKLTPPTIQKASEVWVFTQKDGERMLVVINIKGFIEVRLKSGVLEIVTPGEGFRHGVLTCNDWEFLGELNADNSL